MKFSEWYDSIIVPQLNETLKNVPVQAREALRTASRQTMAACWNAAIDAADEALHSDNPTVMRADRMRLLKVLPIKFEGEMQKFSQ